MYFYIFRTERLARDICRDFGNSPLVALCCLKGGYQFFAHLCEFMINYNGSSGMFQNIVTFMMHTNFVSKETTMKRKWRVYAVL